MRNATRVSHLFIWQKIIDKILMNITINKSFCPKFVPNFGIRLQTLLKNGVKISFKVRCYGEREFDRMRPFLSL